MGYSSRTYLVSKHDDIQSTARELTSPFVTFPNMVRKKSNIIVSSRKIWRFDPVGTSQKIAEFAENWRIFRLVSIGQVAGRKIRRLVLNLYLSGDPIHWLDTLTVETSILDDILGSERSLKAVMI
ncbi:hypothetical protein R1flu_028137 [Riccia fluitans]|uniref:Uncharacterized protein n=1 Tax=Riccia fluitans TaxID=41844 RepID=A0ABD1XKT6_9MARC